MTDNSAALTAENQEITETTSETEAKQTEIRSQMEILLKEYGKLKLLSPKNNVSLVKGFRNEMVVHPVAALQNKLEDIEANLLHNFNSLQKTFQEQIQYLYQYSVKTADSTNQLSATVEALTELAGVSVATLENKVAEIKDRKALEAELASDVAQGLEKVDRPAQTGDTVKISFVGKVNGVAFKGGTGSNVSLKLGTNQFIPGFETQLVGKSAGEIVNVSVSFPEDYQNKELAGVAAVFETTVHAVKTVIIKNV